jgi:hypothetical protein
MNPFRFIGAKPECCARRKEVRDDPKRTFGDWLEGVCPIIA